METCGDISTLPIEVLAHILKFVPSKKHLFLVSKQFYNAACIACVSDYRLLLHGNREISNSPVFDNIIGSKRLFHELHIDELNLQVFSKNEVKKLQTLLQKFGASTKSVKISFNLIAEQDIFHLLSFFPNMEKLVILKNRNQSIQLSPMNSITFESKKTSAPKAILKKRNQSIQLSSLNSIIFESKTLQFNQIFDKVQLSDKFKSLDVTIPEVSNCFTFLKKNSSIENLSITSKNPAVSIPINHLKLSSLSLRLPKLSQLLPFIKQQTNLHKLDNHYRYHGSELYSTEDVSGNANLLQVACTMKHLTHLTLCIDGVADKYFINLSTLSKLQQLSVASKTLNTIKTFSTISMPNVTRLLMYFRRVRVPNTELIRIAKNFPNVNDLIFDGEYLCDAYLCFAGNLNSLEKLRLSRTNPDDDDDDEDDDDDDDDDLTNYDQDSHYVPSSDTPTKIICSTLKSVNVYVHFVDEQLIHIFIIRIALTAPYVENLWIEVDRLKFVQTNFIYILRNFKNLKNIKLSYDLRPDEEPRSVVDVEEYGKKMEIQMINSLKEYCSNLEFVEISINSLNNLNEELWKQSFRHQFESIKIEDSLVTMKKDGKTNGSNMFALAILAESKLFL